MITIKNKQKTHTNKNNKPKQQQKNPNNNKATGLFSISSLCFHMLQILNVTIKLSQSSELGTQHLKLRLNPAAYLSKKYF